MIAEHLKMAIELWSAQGQLPELKPLQSTESGWQYAFSGITPALTLAITDHVVAIIARAPNGDCWDRLLDCEVDSVTTTAGVQCSICVAEGKTTSFASQEALIQDHVLEPIQEWLTANLERSTHLLLRKIGGGTWAELADGGYQSDGSVMHSILIHLTESP